MLIPAPSPLRPPQAVRAPTVTVGAEQDCAHCRGLRTCWDSRLTPKGIVVNLLVCRLKRGIAKEKSTGTLLTLIQPKIRMIARRIQSPNDLASRQDLERDIQSVIVESLLTKYILGDYIHPLRWLFSQPHGAVTRWAARYAKRQRREANAVVRYGTDTDFDSTLIALNYLASDRRILSGPATRVRDVLEYDPQLEEHARAARVAAVVDDGHTLTTDEYRVLSFCLTNTGLLEDGLHRLLAVRMGVSRQVVTKLFSTAVHRALDASGDAGAYWRAKRLTPPRKRGDVTPAEVADLVRLRQTRQIPFAELAWMYGVSERQTRQLVLQAAR